ncbi:hypothetical protein OHC33_000154 [Knufia fluminis]|uniref:N-acetyltransferase domain-containing protein n=1 Tax=Knufia fluminis TaxID=191047 RepID=A0AAN8ISL3_9EURO|nr:hypothetical protein OHC33_000154 [Knufia fluminis]
MPPKQRANPPLPQIHGLRFATSRDIWRAGLVISAGFGVCPEAAWLQPYLRTYPQDSLLSAQQSVEWAIRSEDAAILVVEDHYDPAETETMHGIVPHVHNKAQPMPGEKIVVGVAVWWFDAESPRTGQFADTEGPFPELDEGPHRDEYEEHVSRYNDKNDELLKKYLSTSGMELHTLVIHPTYWRRGHGRTLVEWGMRLADIDQEDLCICATNGGLKLYRPLGCELLESWRMEGDEVSPTGVAGNIVRYVPRKERGDPEDGSVETAVMALSERLSETEFGGEQDKGLGEKNGLVVR